MISSPLSRVTRRVLLATALTLGMAPFAQAERIVRIIVPFGPGAVQDTVARTFSNELGQALGATVVVENRAGAGGSVGTGQVAKSASDGNTLVLAAASHHLAGHLYAKLPYDPVKDFVGVSFLGRTGYVVGVSSESGIQSVTDLIQRAKAKPGQLNYASAGNGSASHLATASFASQAGVQLQHIPMKSTGDATTELLAGRVQVVTGASIGMLAFQKDPRVKLLAYSGQQRSRFLPDLPTVAESGVPGYAFDSWLALLAPAGTPPEIISRIQQEAAKSLNTPAIQEKLLAQGAIAGGNTPQQFSAFIDAEHKKWAQVVKISGAKVD